MKLRNKKTGEIVERVDITIREEGVVFNNDETYTSLAGLNDEWEDYEEPKDERWYWCVDYITCGVDHLMYDPDDPDQDEFNESIGNYFETKEEAEQAVEKLKAAKRLKDKGISFEIKVIDRKWYLTPKAEPEQRTFDEAHDAFKDIMFIFGGEE